MAKTYKIKVLEREDTDGNCEGFENEVNEAMNQIMKNHEEDREILSVEFVYDDDRDTFRAIIFYKNI